MPLYEYQCKDGHRFEQYGRIDLSDAPTRCPVRTDPNEPKSECFATVEKILSAPSRAFPGADSWRK